MKALTPGRYYVAEVQAANAVGKSAWVHSGLLRTASTVPSPPRGLRGMPETASTTGVSFCWEEPGETGGEPVDGYEVAWMRISYREKPPEGIADILAADSCQKILTP